MSDERATDSRPPWIGPEGRRTERLELHLSYRCTNRCRFCSEDHRMQRYRQLPMSWGRVASVLRRHAARGIRSLHLTGGEPTIHPRFRDVLVLARKLRLRTSVSTNGGMLHRESFARRVAPLLDEVMFSIHGPSAAIHEHSTRRRGSFANVTGAVRLVERLRPDIDVHVNTVITRDNVDAVTQTVALADSLGASLIVVSNVSPEGRALDNYAQLAVPLERLAELLPTLPAHAPHAIVRFFGAPMCLLGTQRTLSNDLHWDPRVTVEWTSRPGRVLLTDVYSWTPARGRVRPEPCDQCLQKDVCMGVFERYRELFPTDALQPQAREEP